MWYKQLKWITFGGAAAALVTLQVVFFGFADRILGPVPASVRTMLFSLAVVAGVFIFNEYVFHVIGRVQGDLERERQRLAALHQASQGLASLVGMERHLAPTLDNIRRVIGADLVAWIERDTRGSRATCRVLVGERHSPPGEVLRFRLGQGLAGRAISAGRTIVIDDAATIPAEDRLSYPLIHSEGLRTAMAAAAGAGRTPLGALIAGWRKPRRITAADRAFLENVANQLGVALENWRLYRETQRMGALEERDRLAREMHDGLAQALTYLKLKAEALQQHAVGGRWDVVRQGLEDMRLAAVETLGDVRQAIVDLRAAGGGSGARSFLTNLAEYLHTWSQLNDIEVELVAGQEDVQLDVEAEVQVIRILQEALQNVRKHSGSLRARVRVVDQSGGCVFTVDDDGQGFDPAEERPGHFGLALMKERASTIGASIEVDSAPGKGARVTLRLPPRSASVVSEVVG